MALKDYPKQLILNRPVFEHALGINPVYTLEVISTRSLKTQDDV